MDIDQVIFIHDYLTKYFEASDDPVSPPGIKNRELLESAIARPFMTCNGEFLHKGVFRQAAALFHGIISNHTFHNGNKRTALLATTTYLGDNGYWVTQPTDEELFEFTRRVAAHELIDNRDNEVEAIAIWLQENSRRRTLQEQQLNLRQLRELLSVFGYELSETSGRTIEILKGGKVKTKIRQKGAKGQENYDKQYVRGIRRRLKLTYEYGVDSFTFYNGHGFDNHLNTYMKIHGKVMRELAKI